MKLLRLHRYKGTGVLALPKFLDSLRRLPKKCSFANGAGFQIKRVGVYFGLCRVSTVSSLLYIHIATGMIYGR